ncbi:MAG: lysozyme [Lachnospiraceae bacterium]|nr:lysozyme [Lachnospiraceae bacterium]MBE5991575.1 lysozyme [Paenibacillaceae bacterium]
MNGAANEFDKWIYADGKVLDGLVRRREAEKEDCRWCVWSWLQSSCKNIEIRR